MKGKVLVMDQSSYWNSFHYSQAKNSTYAVAMNLGKQWRTINISKHFNWPEKLRVVLASIESQYQYGQSVNGTELQIPNNVAIILTV